MTHLGHFRTVGSAFGINGEVSLAWTAVVKDDSEGSLAAMLTTLTCVWEAKVLDSR